MIVRLLVALILGAIAYFIAQLFLDHTLSSLIGVLVAIAYYFGDHYHDRRL